MIGRWATGGSNALRAGAASACLALLACGGTASHLSPCAASVAAYCASGQQLCSWSDYQDPARFDCQLTTLSTSCGPYDVAAQRGTQSGTAWFYDRSSGALVAVVAYDAQAETSSCLAGPSGGFAEPACAVTSFVGSCP